MTPPAAPPAGTATALTVKSRRPRSAWIEPPSISAMSSGRRPATRKTRGPGRSFERKTARPAPSASSARAAPSASRAIAASISGTGRPRQASRTAPPTIQASVERRRAHAREGPHFAAPEQARESESSAVERAGRHTGWYNFQDATLFRHCHPRGRPQSGGARPSSAVGGGASAVDRADLARRRIHRAAPADPGGGLRGAGRSAGHARPRGRLPGMATARRPWPGNAPRQAHGYGVVPRVVGSGASVPSPECR